jgi:D-3-phosphoglycerate dehydrogenase
MPKDTRWKPALAITIRSFALDDITQRRLESQFRLQYVNTCGRRLSEDDLSEAIRHADAVIAGTETFSRKVIEDATRLKIISRVGVGLDSIDLDAARERNILVMITASSTTQPVAEHALSLMYALSKHIIEYYVGSRSNDHTIQQGALISGKTVGIIGMGRIGNRVAEMVRCMGCQVIFYDPFVSQSPNSAFRQTETLFNLLSRSDIVTLHIPSEKNKPPVLDREAFNQCRTGVILINTARGSLVDEEALLEALKSGKVGGAGLDVVGNEPYSGPLLSYPNVIITPHVASNTYESRKAMEEEAVENIVKALIKG